MGTFWDRAFFSYDNNPGNKIILSLNCGHSCSRRKLLPAPGAVKAFVFNRIHRALDKPLLKIVNPTKGEMSEQNK
jgi:hypothetical protein